MTLPPGRELDVLVAEKVIGNQVISIGGDPETIGLQEAKILPSGSAGGSRNLAHYSTDILAAWEVVEKFENDGGIINYGNMFEGERKPWVSIGYLKSPVHSHHAFVMAHGETAAHAVCLAALKACGKLDE